MLCHCHSSVGAVYLVMVRVGCVPLGGWHSTGAGVQWPGGGGGDHTCTLHTPGPPPTAGPRDMSTTSSDLLHF